MKVFLLREILHTDTPNISGPQHVFISRSDSVLYKHFADYIQCYVIRSTQSNTKSFWDIFSVKSGALVISDQIIP